MSGQTFALDLQRFARKAGGNLDQVLRWAVMGVTKEVTEMTPVGDPTFWKFPKSAPPGYTGGLAKNNWFWGVQVVDAIDPTPNKGGAGSLTRASTFASNLRAGGVIYLTNNLPYAMALEYGHSQRQAPAGMVRITVARWQSIVDRAARKL